MPTVVVLDTNALLLPFTAGTDLEREIERLVGPARIVVPAAMVQEIDSLTTHGGAEGRAAKAARKLMTRFDSEATPYGGDDGLLDVARRLKAVVVTNDRKLQEECSRSGLQVLHSRETGRLAFRKSGSGA
ncbi:MAG TPA: hypothetical protein VI796_05620 [Candidatus Thermoplasmatota archaeon]|nr:hypothetical protein [Candidatus Thermoplasmatota archaeon]